MTRMFAIAIAVTVMFMSAPLSLVNAENSDSMVISVMSSHPMYGADSGYLDSNFGIFHYECNAPSGQLAGDYPLFNVITNDNRIASANFTTDEETICTIEEIPAIYPTYFLYTDPTSPSFDNDNERLADYPVMVNTSTMVAYEIPGSDLAGLLMLDSVVRYTEPMDTYALESYQAGIDFYTLVETGQLVRVSCNNATYEDEYPPSGTVINAGHYSHTFTTVTADDEVRTCVYTPVSMVYMPITVN